MTQPPSPVAEAPVVPFPERMRLTCRNWAAGEHATPMGVIVFYWVKYALLYIGGWALWVGFSRGETPLSASGMLWAPDTSARGDVEEYAGRGVQPGDNGRYMISIKGVESYESLSMPEPTEKRELVMLPAAQEQTA